MDVVIIFSRSSLVAAGGVSSSWHPGAPAGPVGGLSGPLEKTTSQAV